MARPEAHEAAWLPAEDPQRRTLHDELHARPAARIRLPAWVLHVAVLNAGVSREAELAHLAALPGAPALPQPAAGASFLSLRLDGATLKWERHSEFTRYTLVQPLPPATLETAVEGEAEGQLLGTPAVPPAWLRGIPGTTFAAIELALLEGPLDDAAAVLRTLRRAFGAREVAASWLGDGYALAATDFRIGAGGFERIVVCCEPATTATRAGRIGQRLLELEAYRMMALRGLPVAKALAAPLGEAERDLADITATLEAAGTASLGDDAALLARLSALAARVERATAEHGYRFSATAAYDAIVRQRIAELRERALAGTQTLGVFLQRRLAPAMATVASTAERLAALSQRIERAGALLRTRVDIATEAQNQQLLAKLTRGQELQLRLQSTVEGLSIAAISYYVVSLLLYGAKAAKAAGLPIHPELAAGASIPLVLWGVWRTVRRIHERLQRIGPGAGGATSGSR